MKIKRTNDPLKPVTLEGKPVEKIVAPAEKRPSPPRPIDLAPRRLPSSQEAEDSPASIKRREELAALLWGAAELGLDDHDHPQPESAPSAKLQQADKEETKELPDRLPRPSIQPVVVVPPPPEPAGDKPPPPPPFAPAESKDDAGTSRSRRRMLLRRACSFPGLLRVLIPEQSFQPRLFAVRIIDLNPGGAQVETRQLNRDLSELIRRERRFARLEALLPGREKMHLSGRIAWASYGTDISRMGLEFERLYPEVGDAFVADIADGTDTRRLSLASPSVDPFPSMTSKEKYTFCGRADDAQEIIVRNGTSETRCAVSGGRFEVEVTLAPERSNFVSFTACKDGVFSIPTPACIAHRAGQSDTMSYSDRKLVEEFTIDADGRHLTLRMGGSAGQFFRVLKKLEEAMEHVQEMEMAVEITGDAANAAAVLETLKKDG